MDKGDGKGNNSEVDHAFCLEARLRTSKIVLRPIFLSPRPLSPSFSPIVLSSLPFSVAPPPPSLSFSSPFLYLSLSASISFPQRRVDACVRTQARKVLLSPTLMHIRRRTSNLFSLSLSLPASRSCSLVHSSLFSLASLLLSNLTPRKRAYNRVSALFNVGGLLLTNTSLKSSSGSFHLPLLLLPPPLPLPPLSSS